MAIGAIYQPPKVATANEPKDAGTVTPPVVVTPPPANDGQANAPVANDATPQTDDLLSRVTQFEVEQNPASKTPEEQDDVLFSDKDLRAKLDAITDPALRQQFIDMRKSMIRGVNDKFQEIAHLRKEIESLKSTSKPKFVANSIDELLNSPEFLNEAKAKLGQNDNSPISGEEGLSEETRTYIKSMEQKLKSLEDGLNQKQSQEANQEWNRQHETLSSRYKNYDRQKVDEVANGLITGKVKATPEYIYKVVYHDENVKKAYELGRRDGSKILGEKKQFNNSIESTNAVPLDSVAQDKEESNLNFMQRIIAKRLAGAK